MSDEEKKNSQKRFTELIAQENFLGAWLVVKSLRLDRTEEGIWVGSLANALQQAISVSRQNNDKEKISFLRSILSWVLRDFPGLASLYREQIRPASPLVPEVLGTVWNDFPDILSGRKTLDEDFRQRMDEAFAGARAKGIDTDAISQAMQDAATELQKSFSGARDFFGNMFPTDAKVVSTKSPGSGSSNESIIKVHIQNTKID